MIKILHLYYDLMNLYGEYGNVEVLKRHLIDQGLKVQVETKSISDKIDFNHYDFIYCGSGLESNQKVALKHLLKNKKSFKQALDNNVYMLFTGNAMELLANTIDKEKALGIVDIDVKHTDKRHSGDVILTNKEFGEIAGFINKCSIIKYNQKGLFNYVFKDEGINDDTTSEGYRINNLIGTHTIGPILAKNPKLLKYLVTNLALKKNKKFKYKNIKYPYEEGSYNVTLNALKGRIKTN